MVSRTKKEVPTINALSIQFKYGWTHTKGLEMLFLIKMQQTKNLKFPQQRFFFHFLTYLVSSSSIV